MLDGLASVDWDKLITPHIPSLLQELASDNRKIVDNAWGQLGETLIPWTLLVGSRRPSEMSWFVSREALFVTIPFLIELLTYETVAHKDPILDLLNDIACYVEADMFMPYEPQNEKRLYQTNARKTYNTVLKGKPIYEKLTEHTTADVAANASHILKVLDMLKDIMERWPQESDNTE